MWNSLRIYNFLILTVRQILKHQRKALTEGSRDGARRSIFHSTFLVQKFQLPSIVCKNQPCPGLPSGVRITWLPYWDI